MSLRQQIVAGHGGVGGAGSLLSHPDPGPQIHQDMSPCHRPHQDG